jgi:serine protease Do
LIRKTLPSVKEATWAVFAPSPREGQQGAPTAIGTCFSIDPTGFMLSASHVVDLADQWGGIVWLQRPATAPDWGVAMLEGTRVIERWPDLDLALLKVEIEPNRTKAWLQGRRDLPFVHVSFDLIEDEEGSRRNRRALQPEIELIETDNAAFALGGLAPRTTSAVVASAVEVFGPVQHPNQPRFVVVDKAFNYGNSGGPLIDQESGHAVAVVVRFQPVRVPQGDSDSVVVPSLYGVASAITNIETDLRAVVPRYGPT